MVDSKAQSGQSKSPAEQAKEKVAQAKVQHANKTEQQGQTEQAEPQTKVEQADRERGHTDEPWQDKTEQNDTTENNEELKEDEKVGVAHARPVDYDPVQVEAFLQSQKDVFQEPADKGEILKAAKERKEEIEQSEKDMQKDADEKRGDGELNRPSQQADIYETTRPDQKGSDK